MVDMPLFPGLFLLVDDALSKAEENINDGTDGLQKEYFWKAGLIHISTYHLSGIPPFSKAAFED